jgi:hypothetical protein
MECLPPVFILDGECLNPGTVSECLCLLFWAVNLGAFHQMGSLQVWQIRDNRTETLFMWCGRTVISHGGEEVR